MEVGPGCDTGVAFRQAAQPCAVVLVSQGGSGARGHGNRLDSISLIFLFRETDNGQNVFFFFFTPT